MENGSLRRHTTLGSWMPSWTTSPSSTIMGNCVQLMNICRRQVSSTTCHSGSGDLHPVARRSVLACRDATQLAVSAAGRLRPVPRRSDPRAVLRISPATLPGKALFRLREDWLAFLFCCRAHLRSTCTFTRHSVPVGKMNRTLGPKVCKGHPEVSFRSPCSFF